MIALIILLSLGVISLSMAIFMGYHAKKEIQDRYKNLKKKT